MTSAVELMNLSHYYFHRGRPVPTLNDVSFAVPAGALAAIVGPSGSGKTTLLRCLAGLEPATSGKITVGDLTVPAGRSSAVRLRGRVGLVFQTFELFPHLTVLENCVLAPITVRQIARSEAEAAARTLLEQLGLADKADAHPSRLSGGQCQRVAIARALAMAPACLLYDEPTSALDPARKDEVLEILSAVRSRGITQIVVSHDALVANTADLVFRLEAGRVTPDCAGRVTPGSD